ncbi:mitochondrial carrier domain-containing protein [Paraphysoderma sedebokerense]|nr:mitochondrial carrier domain-containing protein [Paraphysoderma sedebokerense]
MDAPPSSEFDDYESLPPTATPLTHLIAGALAGITEHVVMYPLDSVKTRLQILTPNPQAIYSGMTNAISRITTTEGASALFRGVNSVVLGAGPAHALYFASYERMKVILGGDQEGHHPWKSAAAGACATLVHDGFMNPFDVVKQRMQSYTGSHYRSITHCFMKILRTEGVTAFYISYPTTLTMSIPFQSIHFSAYESFRKSLNPSGEYDPKAHIIAGGLAGAIAAAVTNPLDVAKTVLQTKGDSSDAAVRSVRGFADAMKIIYERNGLKGFWKGVRPRVMSHAPATAISWTTYEYFKYFLSLRQEK